MCLVMQLTSPTAFKNLDRLFPVQFKMGDGRLAEKRGDDCFINGEKYNLGNPEYFCYPINYSYVQIKAYSRHYKRIGEKSWRAKNNIERLKNRIHNNRNRPRYYDSKYNHGGYSTYGLHCEQCGGEQSWCSCCETWSRRCCVDWGTCMCS